MDSTTPAHLAEQCPPTLCVARAADVVRQNNVAISGGENATFRMWREDYADPSKGYVHSEWRAGIWVEDSADVT